MIRKTQPSMNTFANATPRSPEGAAQRSIKWGGNPLGNVLSSSTGATVNLLNCSLYHLSK